MSVAVPRQKKDLEKQHAGCPDGRPAAKPGQDILCDQGLDLEEKKRANKNCYGGWQDANHRGTCAMYQGNPGELTKEFIKKLCKKRAISYSIHVRWRTHRRSHGNQ